MMMQMLMGAGTNPLIGGNASAVYTVEIARDASGTDIVSTSTITLQANYTP